MVFWAVLKVLWKVRRAVGSERGLVTWAVSSRGRCQVEGRGPLWCEGGRRDVLIVVL